MFKSRNCKSTFSFILLEVLLIASLLYYAFLVHPPDVLLDHNLQASPKTLKSRHINCEYEKCVGQNSPSESTSKSAERVTHKHQSFMPSTAHDGVETSDLMIMTGCPEGWSLQVMRPSENNNPPVQVCRNDDGNGLWKCANNWQMINQTPYCVFVNKTNGDNRNLDTDNLQNQAFYPEYAPISAEKQILFIHVPKAGGTRIETSFLFDDQREKLGGHYLGGHHHISSFDKNYFKDYHKFCMVRHPCSRLISIWESFSRGLGNEGDKSWVESNLDDTSRKSFDAFIKYSLFPGGPIHVEDELHLQTQAGMLFDESGTFGLDQMLIFERWRESLRELEKKIKVNVTSLKTSHNTTGRYKSCQEMYNPKTWDKLLKVYALDFCVLGYSTKLEETNVLPSLALTPKLLTERFHKCKNGSSRNDAVKNQRESAQKFDSLKNDTKCTIFTYYQPQNGITVKELENNRILLNAWQKVWSTAGWKTHVLTEEDAKTHPQYESLRKRFVSLPTVNSHEYEAACFMRHVAMAAVGGGWMCDFDVLPFYMPTCASPLNNGNFTIYNRFIPSLVSGSSEQFTRLANLMADAPWDSRPELYTQRGRPHVSDMLVTRQLYLDKEVTGLVLTVEVRELFTPPFVCHMSEKGLPALAKHEENPWAIHYSHAALDALSRLNLTSFWQGSRWNSKDFEFSSDAKRAEFMIDSTRFIRKTCLPFEDDY